MYTSDHIQGMPGIPFRGMLTSILPFLAIATPGLVMAAAVTNTATITAPNGVFEANADNNSAQDSDAVLAEIIAVDDVIGDVNGVTGSPGVVNVFGGDTIDGTAADPTNTTVGVAPGSVLPDVLTFDPTTGLVGVLPGAAPGDYVFDYEICQIDAPSNCETASVTITVVAPPATIAGTVYFDEDGDRQIDDGEPRLSGWTVEIRDGDTVIASVITGADGSYEITDLPGGRVYDIVFRHSSTGVAFEVIENVRLEDATTLPDQNLPIDPSGIVYDAITRAPISGATLTFVDRNGSPLPADCFADASQQNQVTGADGGYRFDIVPGAAGACPVGEADYAISVAPPAGYSFSSTILPPQPTALDPTGQGDPLRVDQSMSAPTSANPVYYLSFELESGDPDVVNNHIPLDPFLSRDQLVVTKTSPRRSASTGDLVPYEITVRNSEQFRRGDVDVVDVLPRGMTYVTGSALVNGVQQEPELTNGNRELVWRDQIIPANSSVTYQLTLIVGSGVVEGQTVNTGLAENGAGVEISNRGTASVTIVPSTVFDCSELIGQVFVDKNGNGYQDKGEEGLPSVRLATVKGELITTDEYGRYHIACAAVPDARIGSNYVLKLDEASLPQGWIVTSDNPRTIRLTRGKMGELNFGVVKATGITLTFEAQSFGADGQLTRTVLQRLEALASEQSAAVNVQATYALDGSETQALVTQRLDTIRTVLSDLFGDGREGSVSVIQIDAAAPGKPGRE